MFLVYAEKANFEYRKLVSFLGTFLAFFYCFKKRVLQEWRGGFSLGLCKEALSVNFLRNFWA